MLESCPKIDQESLESSAKQTKGDGYAEEVAGQDKAISEIKKATRRGYGGEAYWLSGASGTGKTTIARLIAGEVAGELATQEENGQDIDVEYVRRMRAAWSTTVLPSAGSDKSGRAWIINEAHRLRAKVCELLLTVLEEIPAHVVIFTTTTEESKGLFEGYDNSPAFMSRCLQFKLARKGLCEPFAERARMIAQKEGLDRRPIEAYQRLAKDNANNLRDMLKAIQQGAMWE
jgi:DNA polymerase III subunit gamma/tau